MDLHITKALPETSSLPPAAVRWKERLVKTGKNPFLKGSCTTKLYLHARGGGAQVVRNSGACSACADQQQISFTPPGVFPCRR